MILLSHFFISWQFFPQNQMYFPFSINSSKYVDFLTLVLNTILILIKFPFHQYISRRYLNFDPTDENGCHGDFPPLWKSEILGLADDFLVCTKDIGQYNNVNEEFSLESKLFTGLCCRAWTIIDTIIFIFILDCSYEKLKVKTSHRFIHVIIKWWKHYF